MDDHRHYIVGENIERFEALLRSGQLDRQQIDVVKALLAQARAELAALEPGHPSEGPASVTSPLPAADARGRAATGPVLPPSDSCASRPLDQVEC
jgi:hypothetical protein